MPSMDEIMGDPTLRDLYVEQIPRAMTLLTIFKGTAIWWRNGRRCEIDFNTGELTWTRFLGLGDIYLKLRGVSNKWME
jgi:hypothetical protein